MPALPPYIIEPIFEQFAALLPERNVDHPLGCHRSRIPDRVIFDKLVQVLVFGCAYERIADEECSASTLRRRRDEWIGSGAMEKLREMVLEAYDRIIGLEVSDIAVDCCITKAPCGGERAGRSPVDRGKRGIKRSTVVDANGIPLGTVTAPANRHDSPLLGETLDTLEVLGPLPERMGVHLDRGYDSEATRQRLYAIAACKVRSPRRANRLRCRRPSVGWWNARAPGTTPTRSSRGARRSGVRSWTSGSPSLRWSSLWAGSSEKLGLATVGRGDPAAGREEPPIGGGSK